MPTSTSMSWPDSRLVTYGVAGSLATYLLVKYGISHWTPIGLRRPPGPGYSGFPKRKWYETFSEMQTKYGDIIYFNLMGSSFMVFNSLEEAEELLNKRSNNYSGRPVHMIVTVLMDFGWSLLFRQPGKDFNEQRKVFRKAIGPQSVSQFDTIMEHEAEGLVSTLSGFAGDVGDKFNNAVAAVILKMGYGEKLYKDHGEELTKINLDNIRHLSPILATFYTVLVIPWLRYVPAWFPGAGFQKAAQKGKVLTDKLRNWAWSVLQQDIEDGTADSSLVSQYYNSSEFSNSNLKEAVAVLYGAGVNTTSTACEVMLWNMVTHPDVQHKIQAELDEVLGQNRLPTPTQSQQLEYLQAVWRESMRLDPPAPLALPHVTTQADSWKGYYIPKNTRINPNIGFMLRDPRLWGPDADEFRPERFLGEGAKSLPDITSIPFGFGKRICPGRYLADRVGLLFIASILSTYEVSPIDGEKLPDPMPFTDNLTRRPVGFRCQFKLRR